MPSISPSKLINQLTKAKKKISTLNTTFRWSTLTFRFIIIKNKMSRLHMASPSTRSIF